MTAPLTLSRQEAREYNLAAALLALAAGRREGLACEVSDELRKTHRASRGDSLLVPHGLTVRAGLDTTTQGQNLVYTEPRTFIELLRNRAAVLRGGATLLDNLHDTLAIPEQTGSASAVWDGQNPGVDVADSNLTLRQRALAPHSLTATTSVSRQLLAQAAASVSAETLMRADLVQAHAIALDAAALAGSGTGGQPLGLLNRSDLAAQLIAFGANGAQPTWPLMTEFETQVALTNGDRDPSAQVFLVTPEIRARLRVTDKGGATTTGRFVLSSGGKVAGYPAIATNQLPKALTKGTSTTCHAIVFGDLSQIVIGLWDAFEIVPDPYRLKKQGIVELTSIQLADVTVRHVGAFAVSLDALP